MRATQPLSYTHGPPAWEHPNLDPRWPRELAVTVSPAPASWGSPSSISGRPERLAFSRCRTTRLLLMRRARATKGAEWSSSGVFRASRYCRQFV